MVSPEATDFRDITQNNGHYAVQGHSRSTLKVAPVSTAGNQCVTHSRRSFASSRDHHTKVCPIPAAIPYCRPVTIGHSGRRGLLCFNLFPNDILCRTKNRKLCSYRRRHEHDTAVFLYKIYARVWSSEIELSILTIALTDARDSCFVR